MADDLSAIRADAATHTRELEAIHFLRPSQVRARWGVSKKTLREIPREELPYLEFGPSGRRKYDPRDVAAYEFRRKIGPHAPPVEGAA